MRNLIQRERREWADPNYKLGMINGWLIFCGDGFMNATVVLSSFASKLGAPSVIIGLLPALQLGGQLLPQFLVATRIRSYPYKLPVYRSAAIARALSYVWMVIASALLIHHPTWLLIAFIFGMVINAIASGIGGLPFLEIVSKTVASSKRPMFFGMRSLVGGLLAFVAGLAVQRILASPIAFPYDYTLIFALGTISYCIGYALINRVKEPPDLPQPPSDIKAELRALPQTFRDDPDFRAFLGVRILLAFASLGEPFYAVHALANLHMPTAMIGVFLMALTGAAPLSNIIWVRMAQRRGSRRIIRWSSAIAGLAPLLALSLPAQWAWLYLLVFICSSVATQGFTLGHTNHLLNLAPNELRSRYIGALNTIVGVALFAPVFGGILVDTLGYRFVFAIGAFLYAVAWWRSGKLRRDA